MSNEILSLICTFITIILFCLFIWIYHNGLFCKVFGHKKITDGWEEKRTNGRLMYRKATHWHCERCSLFNQKYELAKELI